MDNRDGERGNGDEIRCLGWIERDLGMGVIEVGWA